MEATLVSDQLPTPGSRRQSILLTIPNTSAGRNRKNSQQVFDRCTQLARLYPSVVNLGQGFPDTCCFVHEATRKALYEMAAKGYFYDCEQDGNFLHQYANAGGLPRLTHLLAEHYSAILKPWDNNLKKNQSATLLNAQTEILITCGAQQGIDLAFAAHLAPKNSNSATPAEVIIFEPFYSFYEPLVRMYGATPIFVRLLQPITNNKSTSQATKKMSSDYKTDWAAFERAFTPATRMLVLNNPHNPTGKVFTREELERITNTVLMHPSCLILSDEVYGELLMDDAPNDHIPTVSLGEAIWNRTITLKSAGKLLCTTGWKCGWAIAPEHLLRPMARRFQLQTSNFSAPIQHAVANAIQHNLDLNGGNRIVFFERNVALKKSRDWLAAALMDLGISVTLPHAGFFLIADISNILLRMKNNNAEQKLGFNDFDLVCWLTTQHGLAFLPLSAFQSSNSLLRDDARLLAENNCRRRSSAGAVGPCQDEQKRKVFCRINFAKKRETLEKAVNILHQILST